MANHTYNNHASPPRVYAAGAEQVYSMVQIQMTDGNMVGFTVKASPALLQHCNVQMQTTGWLYLFNDTESLSIRAENIAALRFVQVSKE